MLWKKCKNWNSEKAQPWKKQACHKVQRILLPQLAELDPILFWLISFIYFLWNIFALLGELSSSTVQSDKHNMTTLIGRSPEDHQQLTSLATYCISLAVISGIFPFFCSIKNVYWTQCCFVKPANFPQVH